MRNDDIVMHPHTEYESTETPKIGVSVDKARDVRRVRRSLRETCAEFAARFGVQNKTVTEWERSITDVPSNVAKFARDRLETIDGEPDEDGFVVTHERIVQGYERRDITKARLSLRETREQFAKRFGCCEDTMIEWELGGVELPTNVVLFAQERLRKYSHVVNNLSQEERKRLMKIDIVFEDV